MFKFESLLQERQCYIIYNFGVAGSVERQPLLPNHSKICFYKGTKVTQIDYSDDNFLSFGNEPFPNFLDTSNGHHKHDCAGMYFYKSYRE